MSKSATPRFLVHRNPIWRSSTDFILQASLPDDPQTFEQLWTRKIAADRYEICCIPFFLYGVALGDVVSWTDTKRDIRVITPSGRFVFRAWFREDAPQAGLLGDLAALGALVERSSAHLVAIDAQDDQLAAVVSDWLLRAHDEGFLRYETGRI